jgi:AraC-like DNA-binding protein
LIALRIGQQLSHRVLGGFGYLLLTSETLRETIEHAIRYIRLIDDLTQIELHERSDQAALRFSRRGDRGFPEGGIECVFTALLFSLRTQVPKCDKVRLQLCAQLEGSQAGAAPLARALGMSERTLRRRLQDHATSYQQLLDDVRSEQARTWIEQSDDTLEAIAGRLGFADTSSFFHAFKRWTGTTPAQFRRRQRGERSAAGS